MHSDPVDPNPQRRSQFRQPLWPMRLVLGLLTVGLGAGKLLAGTTSYHVAAGLFWICSGAMWLALAFAVKWELRTEGIYEHRYFSSLLLPYSDVLAVTEGSNDAEAIELHYAAISPHIFPRARMTVKVSARAEFLDALHSLAPHAEFLA